MELGHSKKIIAQKNDPHRNGLKAFPHDQLGVLFLGKALSYQQTSDHKRISEMLFDVGL